MKRHALVTGNDAARFLAAAVLSAAACLVAGCGNSSTPGDASVMMTVGVPGPLVGLHVALLTGTNMFLCIQLTTGETECLSKGFGAAEGFLHPENFSGATSLVPQSEFCGILPDATLVCDTIRIDSVAQAAAVEDSRFFCFVTTAGVPQCSDRQNPLFSPDTGGLLATQVALSDDSMCFITTDGAVRCSNFRDDGFNSYALPNTTASTPVPGLTGVTRIMMAGSGQHFVGQAKTHSCAIVAAGKVLCWGFNDHGELGRADATSDPMVPAAVMMDGHPLVGAVALDGDVGMTCAILGDGTVACWGRSTPNSFTGPGTSPAHLIQGVNHVESISISGGGIACALRTDHTVVCWLVEPTSGADWQFCTGC